MGVQVYVHFKAYPEANLEDRELHNIRAHEHMHIPRVSPYHQVASYWESTPAYYCVGRRSST